jgi:hypothetical protein
VNDTTTRVLIDEPFQELGHHPHDAKMTHGQIMSLARMRDLGTAVFRAAVQVQRDLIQREIDAIAKEKERQDRRLREYLESLDTSAHRIQ